MLSRDFLKELEEYVDSNLVYVKHILNESISYQKVFSNQAQAQAEEDDLTTFIEINKKPSFSNLLFTQIDKAGVRDSEIYKKAGIDRRLFSKIRSNPNYHPSKNTAIALCLALNLKPKEADKLIGAAGYTLSDSETFDLVIKFCFQREVYDVNKVNLALDYFSLKPIAGVSE